MRGFGQSYFAAFRQAHWVIFAQTISALAVLIGLRLVTELVPPAVYGTVVLVTGGIALVQGITVGPLMQAVLRFYPDATKSGTSDELRLAANRSLRRPVYLALTASAVVAAIWLLFDRQRVTLVVISLAMFLVEVRRTTEVTFLNASGNQRSMALYIATDACLRPLFAVALVWIFGACSTIVIAGYFWGALAALVIFGYLSPTDNARYGKRGKVFPIEDVPNTAARLQAYALPLTALPVVGWTSGQADRYVLSSLVGVSVAGLYSATYGLVSRPFIMFSAALELMLRQSYYSKVSLSDRENAAKALSVWVASATAGALALLSVFVLFHNQIAALVLSAEYRDNSHLMVWLAVGYSLWVASQVFERVCYAYNQTRKVLLIQGIGAIASLIIGVPMILWSGAEGAAIAVPATFAIQLFSAFVISRRVVGLAR